jgi:hypothetical protein
MPWIRKKPLGLGRLIRPKLVLRKMLRLIIRWPGQLLSQSTVFLFSLFGYLQVTQIEKIKIVTDKAILSDRQIMTKDPIKLMDCST